MRALVLVAMLGGTGCAVLARDHACWPFVARQYRGQVPAAVSRRLARERGTRREVGNSPAPNGWYWRRRHAASLDVTDVRRVSGDWELAPCPGPPPALPRAH